MKTYSVTYTDARGNHVSVGTVGGNNISEARRHAKFLKRNTPEIKRAGQVKTEVRRAK